MLRNTRRPRVAETLRILGFRPSTIGSSRGMQRALVDIVRGCWALVILCACGHSPPPRATCGGGFATLSQGSSAESGRESESINELGRLPFLWITAVRVIGVEPAL